LTEKGLTGTKVGFDISKDAIQLAAGNFFEDAFWCVADLAHSPFAESAFNAILNIFSPSQYQEFDRVLKPGGKVIKVVPNARYLIELREQLYALNTTKREYDNQQVVDRFYEIYPDAVREEVVYSVDLDEKSYGWLMEMTPLSWGASEESLANAAANPLKSVTVAATLLVASKAF
jgi:23S rRNA (guanine745-N1)-methyltransferase/PadR family transcriptional regulator PadR